jgi:methyl-accepting chemotaxis protein
MLKKQKLSTKLILNAVIPVLAIITIIVVSYIAVSGVKENMNSAQSSSMESYELSMLAQRLKLDILQVQQWLTDISATRGLDGLDDGFSEAGKSKVSFLSGLDEIQGIYENKNDKENSKRINAIRNAFNDYFITGTQMAAAYIKDGPPGGNKMMADFDQSAVVLSEAFLPIVQQQKLQGASALGVAIESVEQLQRFNILIGLISISLSFFCTWLVIRSISKPINSIVNGLSFATQNVSTSSHHVSSSSQLFAEGSSQQAASIEETSASMEEMSSMTSKTAESASSADNLMRESSQVITTANLSLNKLNASMEDISKASEETSGIIKIIDNISFQTNLLALNAAVEAARAGEAGAGFAVVADEVRNLAMRAADAAKNTASLIEGTITRVNEGSEILSNTSNAFNKVTDSSDKVAHLIAQIAEASKEQSSGINQVNIALSEMDKVTQHNSVSAEKSADVSGEMNTQVEQLQGCVKDLIILVSGK